MFKTAFTFEDLLLIPKYSGLSPTAPISTKTLLCRGIELNTPFVSAAMDTVTEAKMSIVMARNGGIGIIHRNCTIGKQCKEVIHVKRHQGDMVTNPMSLFSKSTVGDAMGIYEEFNFGTIPIVNEKKELLGLITERHLVDYKNNKYKLLSDIMVPFSELTFVYKNTDLEKAHEIMKEKGKKRLPVIKSEEDRTLVGIYFKKDIQNKFMYPNMSVDKKGRLLVGAAIGVGEDGFDRAQALIEAGADVLCIDTAQGDSIGVIDILKKIKDFNPKIPIIAGNVVTYEGALRLVRAGADAIKVGVGPGAICTTREMTGNGMPQATAIVEVRKALLNHMDIPLIADGGIKTTGDVVKAIALGAKCVMMGSVFSGTDEAPGEIIEKGSGRFKVYRGMGSSEAMKATGGLGNDRYGAQIGTTKKVPEGVSGLVAYKGTVQDILDKYLGALVQSMRVYQGAKDIGELQTNPQFKIQTAFGKIESGVRDIILNS